MISTICNKGVICANYEARLSIAVLFTAILTLSIWSINLTVSRSRKEYHRGQNNLHYRCNIQHINCTGNASRPPPWTGSGLCGYGRSYSTTTGLLSAAYHSSINCPALRGSAVHKKYSTTISGGSPLDGQSLCDCGDGGGGWRNVTCLKCDRRPDCHLGVFFTFSTLDVHHRNGSLAHSCPPGSSTQGLDDPFFCLNNRRSNLAPSIGRADFWGGYEL